MRPNNPEDAWRFVSRGGVDECWPWVGDTFSERYGRFTLRQKAKLAHRHIYELVNGTVPDGLFVMHKCNNKLCCNPAHLTTGTPSKNTMHASTSGAFPVGSSGIKGISRDRKRGYWTAQGYKDGKKTNLYTGPFKEKAIAARKRWEAANDVSFNLTTGERI